MKYAKRNIVTDEFEDGSKKGDMQSGWAWYTRICVSEIDEFDLHVIPVAADSLLDGGQATPSPRAR